MDVLVRDSVNALMNGDITPQAPKAATISLSCSVSLAPIAMRGRAASGGMVATAFLTADSAPLMAREIVNSNA